MYPVFHQQPDVPGQTQVSLMVKDTFQSRALVVGASFVGITGNTAGMIRTFVVESAGRRCEWYPEIPQKTVPHASRDTTNASSEVYVDSTVALQYDRTTLLAYINLFTH